MDSRKRCQQSLNHIQPDKMVVDFGGTAVTGIHVKAIQNLRTYYGLEYRPVEVVEPFQMLGKIEEDLASLIGVDVNAALGSENMIGFSNYDTLKEFKTFWGQTVLVPEKFNTTTDDQGHLLIYPKGDRSVSPSARMPPSGYFFDAINRQPEIVEELLDPKDNLEEFQLVTDADIAHWDNEVTKVSSSGRAVIASLGGTALGDIALVSGMQLKNPKGIRDVTEWYMSTIMRPDYIKYVFDKEIEIAIENYKRYYEVIGDKIDAVFICGTDFGTQDSTFCAPEQFDDLWMPYYKRINNWIHENTNWKTFKHSCGAVESFMPKFIEAGFDIINPVQINALGMDPKHLKNTYGKDLVFWGGGVDTQKILPYGKPQEVKDQTRMLCDIFCEGGGFVFNTVHNMQADIPIENMVAMIDTINEYR